MIVAIKDKSNNYLVAKDTRWMLEEEADDASIESNDSIFPSYDDENTIIAVQGEARTAFFIKYLGGLLPPPNETLTKKYMVTKFVPNLYQELTNMNYADKDELPSFDSEILVIRKSKGFVVGFDGNVEEIGDEEAIGEGARFADGVLLMSKSKPPLERIMQCFNYVSNVSYHVSTNVIVANSGNKDNWIIYDEDDAINIVNHTFHSKIDAK